MNNKNIVDALVNEDLYTAKKLINETLLQRMGKALEEKLIDFGPTIFNEAAKPDFLDMDGDGDKEEPMKKAAKEAKAKKNESVDSDETTIAEEFEQELKSLVEEIEQETGTQLSEEEIMEIAENLLEILSEENDEDEDEEDEEDEDDENNQRPAGRRTMGETDY
jgi:hypothetical protein